MIYLHENENNIEKYNINYNREDLELLKKEIILKCGKKVHEHYEGAYGPSDDNEHIYNLVCNDTGKYKEYFGESKRVYEYSYDYYYDTKLSKLIELFLCYEDTTLLEFVFGKEYESENDIDKLNEQIEELMVLIQKELNDLNIENLKEMILELEKLKENVDLYKDRKADSTYIPKLKSIFDLELVDSISLYMYNKVKKFMKD